MAYSICEPCVGTKDTACVDVCPVDCIHPRQDEDEFEAETMLYIHPEECIDCGRLRPGMPRGSDLRQRRGAGRVAELHRHERPVVRRQVTSDRWV